MATLNTLRTKMGWLLMVVIGLALLAFLLGDLSSSGSSLFGGSKMTVGEVAGESISYEEFASSMNHYTSIRQMMTGTQSLTQDAVDQVKDETWQNAIAEMVLLPNYEKLGIAVSEAEQIDMVSGTYISPVITSIFTNPSTGAFDRSILRQFVSNIPQDPTGSSEVLWQYFKDNMNKDRLSSKYLMLVNRGMFVTDLQVEQSLANSDKSYDASYVVELYSTIADSTIAVSSSEIKAYYDAHRNDFMTAAVRDIEYVLFNVLPSEADYADAQRTVDNMAAEFAESDAPFQYAQLNSHVTPDASYYSDEQLSGALAVMAESGDLEAMNGPILNGDTYTMSCISDVKMMPDSIGAKHILLATGSETIADSIVMALRSGASFSDLSDKYSLDPSANINGGDLGRFAPEVMIPEFSEAIVASRVGDVYTISSQFGLHVVQTTYKSPAVKKTQFATVTYQIEPSALTDQDIYAAANSFIEKANGSSEAFNSAVNEEALSKRVARVRSTDTSVVGLDDSRSLVRWAYSQEAGDVSAIMKIGNDYVVASLTSVIEAGYAALDKVTAEITPMVRREKKAAMLAERMTGSSIDAVAQAVGGEVKSVSNVTFSSYYLDGVGVEPRLSGAMTAATQGALSKAVEGNMGVYKFTVTSSTDVEGATIADERVRLQSAAEAYISDRATQAVMYKSDIQDYRIKFF